MKVRCKVDADCTRIEGWLEKSEAYSVLTIDIFEGGNIFYRIFSKLQGIPVLFEASYFEIVSNEMPREWLIYYHDGYLEIAPEEWVEPGFWDKYFDDDIEAIEKFKEISSIIMSS